MEIHSIPHVRYISQYNCWNNRYNNTYDSCYYRFQDTSQNNPFFRERNKEKKKIIEEKIKQHHEEIFNMYQQWINTDFLIDIDLRNFDTSKLFINVSDQIIPKHMQTDMNMTTIQDKSISHLNCNDYQPAYNKFKEIEGLQNNFNNSMTQFLDNHGNNLILIIRTENFTSPEESMNRLLRYLFHKAVMFNAQPEGVSVQLNNFKSSLADPLNISLTLSNPFPEKEGELISYLQNNYAEIINSIKKFENDIGKITKTIVEFQQMLTLIVHNRIDGFKDNCSIEKPFTKKSKLLNMIKSFFKRY